ncbi:MAG: DUF456 domain-containing protein [Rikenellaceae bacterium]
MELFVLVCALLLAVAGVVGAIVPLPGVLFSYAALLCAYSVEGTDISSTQLWVWAAVSIAVSVVDYLLPAYFAKKFGASRSGMTGATIGMFLGFFLFPPLGVVLCPLFGAILGEMVHDKNDYEKAFKVGFGTFVSFIVGTGIKLIVTIWILATVLSQFMPQLQALWEGFTAK